MALDRLVQSPKSKNRFSQLVDLAQTAGPQTVTRHGAPVAVVVSADEYKRMARPKETVLEFLRPLKGSGLRLDTLIAATALTRRLTLVTHNTRDMTRTGATILDPWQS